MKVRSTNFGARIDMETYNVLLNARKSNLYTNEMENLMRDTCPSATIYTTNIDNDIDGEKNCGIKTMNIYSTLTKEKIPILEPKVRTVGHISYIGEAYKINQKTIDLITENLKMIKQNKNIDKLAFKTRDELDLFIKFGEPVIDIGL